MEAYISQVMAAHSCAGLAMGLAQAGQPDRFFTFGHRDVEAGLPVTPQTRFGAASLTKSMTAMAIMQLQERGLLDVRDPVLRYLPEFRTPDESWTGRITLHHLLTHTAGFPPLPTLGAIQSGQLRSVPAMLTYLADLDYELLGAPGTVFSYGNETIALLGAVIERVSDLPYAEYMATNLFGPAGMGSTSFEPPAEAEVTRLYNPSEAGPVFAGPWSGSGPFTPARAICTTITDLLRYTELFRTGGLIGGVRILAEASVAAMMQPWVTEPDGAQYGYCLMLSPQWPGGRLVEHVGATRGVSAWLSLVPARGAAVVVLANTGGVAVEAIARRAIAELVGVELEREELPLEAGAIDLAPYEGLYGGSDGEPLAVRLSPDGSHLELEAIGPIFPVAPDRFLLRERENRMTATFLRDETGAIESLFFGMRRLRRLHRHQ